MAARRPANRRLAEPYPLTGRKQLPMQAKQAPLRVSPTTFAYPTLALRGSYVSSPDDFGQSYPLIRGRGCTRFVCDCTRSGFTRAKCRRAAGAPQWRTVPTAWGGAQDLCMTDG